MGKELFKNIPSKVGDLVKDVRNGRIGLPDLQRPFVWKDNKVRELFDSMLKGYCCKKCNVSCCGLGRTKTVNFHFVGKRHCESYIS